MSKLCLIRHGETDWNRQRMLQGQTDIDLNEDGIKQVRYACRLLEDTSWDVIISSPLKRAATSAEILRQNFGISKIAFDPRLKEQSYGKAEGLSREERISLYPDRPFPGEEPRKDFEDRVMECIHDIASEYQDMNVLVVSHGGSINIVLQKLSCGEIGSGKTRLGNACINMVENTKGALSIIYYNKIADDA